MHKVCKYHHDSRQKRKNAPILFPHLWILYGRPFETIFRPGKTTCSIEGRWMEVMNWMIWLKGVRYEFVYTSSGIQCYKYWSNGVKEGCWILTCLLYLIPPEHHSVFHEDEIPSCSDRSKSSLRMGTWKDLCDWSVLDTHRPSHEVRIPGNVHQSFFNRNMQLSYWGKIYRYWMPCLQSETRWQSSDSNPRLAP